MLQRQFGTTGLHASEIAFGTWALGSDWWGKTDDPDVLIGRAVELGITFFDTGDASTQCGYVLDSDRQQHSEGERPHDWSPEHAREALEGSLRRLGTDYVDLLQLHNPRMDAIERNDLFAELEALRDEGKLKHFGVALGPAIGWREEGIRALETRPIAALQTVYNLLEQEPGRDFLETAERTGAGVMAKGAGDKKTVTIVQTGSPIGRRFDQEATLKGLGLNKRHRRRTLEDTPAVRGMINKVNHLVRID